MGGTHPNPLLKREGKVAETFPTDPLQDRFPFGPKEINGRLKPQDLVLIWIHRNGLPLHKKRKMKHQRQAPTLQIPHPDPLLKGEGKEKE